MDLPPPEKPLQNPYPVKPLQEQVINVKDIGFPTTWNSIDDSIGRDDLDDLPEDDYHTGIQSEMNWFFDSNYDSSAHVDLGNGIYFVADYFTLDNLIPEIDGLGAVRDSSLTDEQRELIAQADHLAIRIYTNEELEGMETADDIARDYREFLLQNIANKVGDKAYEVPDGFKLDPLYPNPFNSAVHIPFHMPQDGSVKIEIYNSAGRKVATPVNTQFGPGKHNIMWEAGDNPSGSYFFKVRKDGNPGPLQIGMLVK